MAVALAGCAQASGGEEMSTGLSWEDAKASTQSMELEIAALAPKQEVVDIAQNEKGGLFSCGATRHTWKGATIITLGPSADPEAALKSIESQLEELLQERGGFAVTNRLDYFGDYAVVAESTSSAEAYLLDQGKSGTIVIDSWSECFTLPEGMYPGGDF